MGTQESGLHWVLQWVLQDINPHLQLRARKVTGIRQEGTRTSSPRSAWQRVSQVSTGPVSQARMDWPHGRDHTMQAARCSWLPGLAQGKWQVLRRAWSGDIDQGHWRGFCLWTHSLGESSELWIMCMANLFKILRKIFTTIWESLFEKWDGEATLTTSAWKYSIYLQIPGIPFHRLLLSFKSSCLLMIFCS